MIEPLLSHQALSSQIFANQVRLAQKQSESTQDTIRQLLSGEISLKPIGGGSYDTEFKPIEIDQVIPWRKNRIENQPEKPRQEEKVVVDSCETIALPGGLKSCQHGILCKERK